MIQERFLLFETLQGFQDMYYRGAIQPTSIAFIKETGQIFAQNSFFAVDANAFKSLSQLAKVNRDYLNDILGIKGPSLEVMDISNLADLLYFTTGYEKGTQLKDLLEIIKDTLRLEIEDASNYLAELIDSLDYRTSLNEEDIEYIQEDVSSINTDIEGLNYSLLELNNYVVKVDSLLTEAINNLSIELNNYKQEINNKIGKPNGLATLDENGIVPSSQLPSYVDDVLEYSSYSTLPTEGSTGIIYVTLDDNKTYRWSGSTYVEISKSLGLGETASTAFPGNRGVEVERGLEAHINDKNNPHKVTKEQLGLDKVDNTPDYEKDVNSAVKDGEGNVISETYVTNEWEKYSWDKKITFGRSQFDDKKDYIAIIKIKKRCVAEFLIGTLTPFGGCSLQRMTVRCTYSASVTTDSDRSIYYTNYNGTRMTIYSARSPKKDMYGNGGIMVKVLRVLSADKAEPITNNFDDYIEYYDEEYVTTKAPFQATTLTYNPPVVEEEDTSATIINVTKSNLSSKNVSFDISENTEFIVKTEDSASLPEGFKFTSSSIDSVSPNTIIDFTFKGNAEGFILSNNGIDAVYEYSNKIYTGDVLSLYVPESNGEWFATLKPAMIASETLEVTADEIGRTTVEYSSASTEISVVGEVLGASDHSWCHTLFYLPFLDKGTKIQTVDIEWGVEHVTDSINAPWFGVTFASRLTTRRIRAGEQYVSGNTHIVKSSDLYPQGGELYEAEYLNYMYSKIQPQIYYQTNGNTADTIKSEVFFRLWLDPQCFPATEENPLTMRIYISSLIINGKRVNPRKVVFDDGTSRPYFLNGYSSLSGAIPLENYLDILPKFTSSDNSVSIDYDYESNSYDLKSAKEMVLSSTSGSISIEKTKEGYDINAAGDSVDTYVVSNITEFIAALDSIKEKGGQAHRAKLLIAGNIDFNTPVAMNANNGYYDANRKVFDMKNILGNSDIEGIGTPYFNVSNTSASASPDVEVSLGFSKLRSVRNILFCKNSGSTTATPKQFSRYLFELGCPGLRCTFYNCTFNVGGVSHQKFIHINNTEESSVNGYHIIMVFEGCTISFQYNEPESIKSYYSNSLIDIQINSFGGIASFTFINMYPINTFDPSVHSLPRFYVYRSGGTAQIATDGKIYIHPDSTASVYTDASFNQVFLKRLHEGTSDYILGLGDDGAIMKIPSRNFATQDKATYTSSGLMSSDDKITLDKVATEYVKQTDLPGIATEEEAGLILSGDDIEVDSAGAVKVINSEKSTYDSEGNNISTTYAKKDETENALKAKVDKVEGKGLSTNDYTTAEKTKLNNIEEGANNYKLPVAGSNNLGGIKSGGDITIDSAGVVQVNDNSHNHSIDNIANLTTRLNSKVEKITGKGLSTNDYTTTEKNKLSGIANGAEVNIINTIKRNGVTLIPDSNKTVNIVIPTKVSELSNDNKYQTYNDVASSIVNIEYAVATGYFTFTMKDGSVKGFYLPIEKFVKSGNYDANTQELVFEIENGNEIRIDVKDLVNATYSGDDATIELINDNGTYKFKLKDSYKEKIDKAETTDNKTFTISSTSTDNQYPSASTVWKAIKDFAYNVTNFTKASSRTELNSTDTVPTLFGKIAKWLSDLKTVAFTGSYNDLTNRPTIPTVGGGTITIKQKGVSKGSFTVNQSSNTTIELTDENTTYGIGNESTAGIVKSDANNVEILSSGKMVARKSDLATYADKGVKGTRIVKGNSSINYVMLGAVGLDYNVNSTFSLTVEVHGAYSGSGSDCNSRLSIYNIVFRLVNNSVAGQIGCVYASDSINNAIIGEIVYPTATTDGMLYLWVNVSEISSQEALNVCVYGDTNKIEIRQSVHAISIPYYSGVLLNPKLCNSIPIGNVTGLQNELNTKVAKILLPTIGNSSEVYVKIATVNLTSTQSNTAQALISGTGDFGGIVKDVAIVSICGRTTNGTQHIRLLKLDKASYNWTIGCGYVKGSNSIDFYLQLNKFNGSSSLIPISEYGATFNTDLTVITTKPSGWVDGSVGSVYSDFNKPTFDITSKGTDAVTDNTLLLTSNVSGIATNKTIYRRSVTLLWNYIKGKISSELGLSTSYSGVAKYSNDIRGNLRRRNNNSRYIEIGRMPVGTGAYSDNSISIYIKGCHNTNFGDSYIFNVTLGTNASAVPYASLCCVMASRTNYNEVLVGELTSTHLILYLDCILQNYCGWSFCSLSDPYKILQYTSEDVYVASIPANGGTKVSQSNKMLAIMDGSGNTITSHYAPKTELSKYLPLAGGTLTGAVTRTITNTKDTVIMPDKDGYGKIGSADNMFFKGYFNEVRVGTEIELFSGYRPSGDVEDGGRYYESYISGGSNGGIEILPSNHILKLRTAAGRTIVNGYIEFDEITVPSTSGGTTYLPLFKIPKKSGVKMKIIMTGQNGGDNGYEEIAFWCSNSNSNSGANVIYTHMGGNTNVTLSYRLDSDRNVTVYNKNRSSYALAFILILEPFSPTTKVTTYSTTAARKTAAELGFTPTDFT